MDILENLCSEQPAYARRVVMLLATYIRGNFPALDLSATTGLEIRKVPRSDLQKAIDVIGRLNSKAREHDSSEWRIDLSYCELDGVNFSSGNFYAANLTRSRCEGSIMRNAIFEGALFYKALLNYTDFMRCNLRGARLDFCTINFPEPVSGGMVESVNFADTYGATFIAANISAIDYLGEPGEIKNTFGTKDTILAECVKKLQPKPNEYAIGFRSLRSTRKKSDSSIRAEENLVATGFQNWPPYNHNDMAVGHHLAKFFKERGLTGWPYSG